MTRNILTFITIITLASSACAGEGITHPFTGKDAAEAVGRAIIKEGAGDEVRVQINGIREDDQLAAAPSVIAASADALTIDKAHKRWDATLLMVSDGKNLAPVRISGRYDEMTHVPVLRQRMQAGDIIAEGDIIWDDVPSAHLRKTTITDMKALIGKSPRRVVSAGRAIRLDEISGPTVVSKGAQVTLVYKTPNLEIKTLGEALENGAQGTVIRVKNITSKSIIQGVVEGEGRVRISSPENLSAGLM